MSRSPQGTRSRPVRRLVGATSLAAAVSLSAAASLSVAATALLCAGCNERALEKQPVQGDVPPAGLTPEQAAAVVARVGDRTITLGDFAATLERMNQFDRLRYQEKKRRRALLQELIDVELLAQEARRRGLHRRPEVQDAIRQVMRDAALAEARLGLPAPAELSPKQVRDYYEKNKEKYREPERRRVSVIVLTDLDKAIEVLVDARKADAGDGAAWGDLYFAHSKDAPKQRDAKVPADLAGDRGLVGPPGDDKGASAQVPPAVRKAVFQLKAIGDVYPKVVTADGKFYVVRMAGRSEGHMRSLQEADRGIRVAILQGMVRDKEAELEAALRKRFPVRIDEAALAKVRLPGGLGAYRSLWSGDAQKAMEQLDEPEPAPAPSAAPSAASPSAAPSASAAAGQP